MNKPLITGSTEGEKPMLHRNPEDIATVARLRRDVGDERPVQQHRMVSRCCFAPAVHPDEPRCSSCQEMAEFESTETWE